MEGSVDTPGTARSVAVSGNYAYVADGYSGLQIVDVSDPAAPLIIGSVDTPDTAFGVAVAGNYAYVADRYSGLQIVLRQCDDDSTPVFLSSFALSPSAGCVNAHWETSHFSDPAEFRLEASSEAGSYNVAYQETAPGIFEANDCSLALQAGGSFHYRLYSREEGSDWILMRSETLQVEAAPLVTA
ncbi:MAG: hypothetical protein QGG33_03490, partial [Candidatus Krumholzibacteria bacterium]|nr:hypothetical protein [Candidatus Krumholzibacteria bacterium]